MKIKEIIAIRRVEFSEWLINLLKSKRRVNLNDM